jgi:hypothetical protein
MIPPPDLRPAAGRLANELKYSSFNFYQNRELF